MNIFRVFLRWWWLSIWRNIHKRWKCFSNLITCYQPPNMFFKKRYSEKFHKFHRKTSVLKYLFDKVAGLNVCNFIKKRLQHKCFPVKFAKCLRITILENICERLFLYLFLDELYDFYQIFLLLLKLTQAITLWKVRL